MKKIIIISITSDIGLSISNYFLKKNILYLAHIEIKNYK